MATACAALGPENCDPTLIKGLRWAREWLLGPNDGASTRNTGHLPPPARWTWLAGVFRFAIQAAASRGEATLARVLDAVTDAVLDTRWCPLSEERAAAVALRGTVEAQRGRIAAHNGDACNQVVVALMDRARAKWSRRDVAATLFETSAIHALPAHGTDEVAWFLDPAGEVAAQRLEWWILDIVSDAYGGGTRDAAVTCDWVSLFGRVVLPIVREMMETKVDALSLTEEETLRRRASLCVPLGQLDALLSARGISDVNASAARIVHAILEAYFAGGSSRGDRVWIPRAIAARAALLSHPNATVNQYVRALDPDQVHAAAAAVNVSHVVLSKLLIALFHTPLHTPIPIAPRDAGAMLTARLVARFDALMK